jgi:hypothetical protein
LHLHCKMFAKVWGCCNFLLLQHVWNCEWLKRNCRI